MEEIKGEDFGKRCPSLPPNYVSLVQLKERWIQQKQKEAAQKQKIASSDNQQQQPKEDNRFNGSPRSSCKNGLGRIPAQGLHAPRNGELRVDADTGFVPRRQWDRNHGKIREEAKRQQKSSKVELRASEFAGGGERGNAKDKKFNRRKNRRPMVKKEGLSEVHLVQTLSGNEVTSGGEEGYTNYENERVMSVCMVGLAPEINGKEENPVSSSGKPPGKQVLDDHIPDSTDSLRVEAISLGKQVVDDQFLSTSDSRVVEAKPRGKQPANGQFSNTDNDRRIEAEYCGEKAINGQLLNNTCAEGSVNEFEVLPKSVSVDESSGLTGRKSRRRNTKYESYKRSGNDEGLFRQRNAFKQEVFRDNEEEEDSLGEGRKAGKGKLGSRFQGNEGNSRTNRNSNEIQLKQSPELVGEDNSVGKEERTTDPETRTGKGAQAYGKKNRDYHWLGKDFGDLSIHSGRKENSSRGHRWRHGHHGIGLHRKGKQVDGGLVWVKKEEKPDTNLAIS